MPDIDVESASALDEVIATPKPKRKRRKKKKKKKTAIIRSDDDDSSDDDGSESLSFANIMAMNKGSSNKGIVNGVTTKKSNNNNKPRAPSNSGPGNIAISTPQELLRHKLTEKDGYKASLVEQAMEEMWDKGLPYDEYDSVVHYLKSGVGVGVCETTADASMASNSFLSDSSKAMDYDCGDEVDAEITATEVGLSSPSPSPLSLQNDGFGLETTEIGEETTVISNGDTEGEEDDRQQEIEKEDEEHASAPARAPTPTPPASMMKKLDMVAGFENLTDAIFALTQWVKQAANVEEIELFCRAEKTSALPTVFRRGISSETVDTKRFEIAVQPALVRLLMAVLDRCGVDELEASVEAEIKERMENTLKQARKVALLAANERNIYDDDSVIGDRVSRFIVSRLAMAMHEMKEYNKIKINNFREEECAESINIENDNDVAMATLMSQRDALKVDATRACTTVQHSMESIFGDVTASDSGPPPSTTSLEIQSITLCIVDQETKNRFDEEKARLEGLKSEVREEGECSETVEGLRESVVTLQIKRMGYQEKIAELKAALEELEGEDEDAALQIENLSTQISEEEENSDAKAKQLEKDISEAKESVRYGNLVGGLAGMMKTYGKSIEKATASKTGKTIHEDSMNETSDHTNEDSNATVDPITKESASRAMEDYLSKIRDYFLKETLCATQLRNRLATNKIEVTDLRSELSQYSSTKGLGSMLSITAQVEESAAQKERTIVADTQRLAALTDDGRFMYNELLARLETYSANAAENSDAEALSVLFPTELLRGVPAAIRALVIVEDCNKLTPFVTERAAEEVSTNSDENTENFSDRDVSASIESKVEDPPASHPSTSIAPEPAPPPAPRFSWASSGSKQAAAPQKRCSLLDIQKEELNRSRENSVVDDSSINDDGSSDGE